ARERRAGDIRLAAPVDRASTRRRAGKSCPRKFATTPSVAPPPQRRVFPLPPSLSASVFRDNGIANIIGHHVENHFAVFIETLQRVPALFSGKRSIQCDDQFPVPFAVGIAPCREFGRQSVLPQPIA